MDLFPLAGYSIGDGVLTFKQFDRATGQTLLEIEQIPTRQRANRPRTHSPVEALTLRWFADMRQGRINRSELTPEYYDHAVEHLSRYLKRYQFGHLPLEAHVTQTRESGSQRVQVVKIHFPCGDAASFLMGLNTEGKITGISLLGMAGD